jgi:electron transfer flavoprotein alpha subunit
VVEIIGDGSPSVRRLELVPPDPRSVDLVHAKRIVAAGAGGASEKLLSAVGELADLLEGSLGATRPVVDEGRLPKERLIGQTGKTVSPELYLALGISGSPHHVAGVQKAGRILAINRDVRAPIFGFSDVGYVADLEAVLPLLLEKIKAWRDRPKGVDDAA